MVMMQFLILELEAKDMKYSIGGLSRNLITNLAIRNSRINTMSSRKKKSKSILLYIKVFQISRLQGIAASELSLQKFIYVSLPHNYYKRLNLF